MKTMRRFKGRIAIIAVAVMLLLTMLVSCGGGNKVELNVGDILLQSETKVVEGQEVQVSLNALNSTELKAVANMLASVYDVNNFDVQEMLIAAKRGYDLTVENGNSGADYSDKGVNMDAVKNVLRAANAEADAKVKIGEDLIEKFNTYDLQTLVNALKTEVDVDSSEGFFGVILVGIGKVLGWITNTLGFGSYFVGICIFAVLIEILMLPFGIKQQKNSIRQAELRPKEMAIRNKYKGRNDQVTMQKMQQEIQEFYQRENFSPFSGCLPLLIQLPIIMALYNIIIDPLHYVLGQGAGISGAISTFLTTSKAAGGLGLSIGGNGGTIAMLSEIKNLNLEGLKDFQFFTNGADVFNAFSKVADKIPNFNIGSVNFGLIPGFGADTWVLLFVPIITFITYFGTSKLNRKFMYQPAVNEGADARQVACSNNMMDITMPAMSTFFTFMVPALVGVYWVFRSLIGLLKQFILSRMMPLPKFTEEDYKAAAREMAGKQHAVKKSENVGKVRSLHFIDDEDFEDTRARGEARRAALEEKERENQQKKSDKTPFGAAPIKEDKKNEDENNSQE